MKSKKTLSDKQMVMALCFLSGMIFMALPLTLITSASLIFKVFSKEVVWTMVDYFIVFFYSALGIFYIICCYKIIKCFLFEWKVKEYESKK